MDAATKALYEIECQLEQAANVLWATSPGCMDTFAAYQKANEAHLAVRKLRIDSAKQAA